MSDQGHVLRERQLFSRYGRVLLYVWRNPGQTGVEIAKGLSLNIGTVWSLIGGLRAHGMLRIEERGRRHVYFVNTDALLGDPVARAVPVGAILEGVTAGK